MKLSEFHTHLLQHSEHTLTFILPDGDLVPAHFHITEAGRVDKSFIDCNSPLSRTATCSLQAWVAADLDHRFTPGKLAGVPKAADPLFLGADLDVEIEYEDCAISQFPVHEATAKGSTLSFHLGAKHTDCLAKDVCLPQAAVGECCGATGCC